MQSPLAYNLLQLQEKVAELYYQRGYTAGPQTLTLGAMEELGELSTAILLTECNDFRPTLKKLSQEYDSPAHEIGDIITYLLALCNKLEINPRFEWLENE